MLHLRTSALVPILSAHGRARHTHMSTGARTCLSNISERLCAAAGSHIRRIHGPDTFTRKYATGAAMLCISVFRGGSRRSPGSRVGTTQILTKFMARGSAHAASQVHACASPTRWNTHHHLARLRHSRLRISPYLHVLSSFAQLSNAAFPFINF